MSQKWEYNGIELEVDLQDANFAEKYEDAFQKMSDAEKKLQKDGKNSELIKNYCRMFFSLFDDLYGPGTSEKLFAGKMNAGYVDEAYSRFIDAAKRSSIEAAKRRSDFLQKYAPNRAQRRHKRK